MTSAMPIALIVVLTISLQIQKSTSDNDVCIQCDCDRSRCQTNTGNRCCWRFFTRDLSELTVTVNCSVNPGDSYINESPSSLEQSAALCLGYHLYHTKSCLTALPRHYCRYNETRAITLAQNSIYEFPDLRCLPLLGKVNLQNNRLKEIPSDAFRGVSDLRELFLDRNEIAYLHPKAFEGCCCLHFLSVTYNKLITVEASVLGLFHPFCLFDFRHNLITNFSNTNNIRLKLEAQYGPGHVDFSHNRITKGPIELLKAIGFTDISALGKFITWGFDIRHNPFHCDCSVYEFAFISRMMSRSLIGWTPHFIACATPARFKEMAFYDLPLDQLTCNISEGCPSKCLCERIPHNRSILVHCQAVGLTSFPDVMPEGRRLILHMNNNSIRTFPRRNFLSRTTSIDLRENALSEVERNVPHLLRNAERVDLRDNDLKYLPETIQALSPEALYLDLHTLTCSCDLKWFPVWLQYSDDHAHLNNITCTKPSLGESILLLNATKEDLSCFQNTNDLAAYELALIITSISLLALVVLLVVFRHELVVVFHHLVARKRGYEQIANRRCQVFVSVNADSHEDSQWVRDVLLPALDHHGLASYLPPRDSVPGSVEMDDVTKGLHHSAAAITVVSPDYVDSGPCLFQFSQAYSHMVVGRHGPLLVFRLSPVSRMATREPRLRAMLTLRMFYATNIGSVRRAVAKLVATLSDVQNNAEEVELDG